MSAVFVALLTFALTFPVPPTETVVLTAYTCEPTNENPMHPCGTPRWGGDPHQPGAACPVDWAGDLIAVPIAGEMVVLRCDDTPYHNELYWEDGLYFHVDARRPTLQMAKQTGIGKVTIYHFPHD